MLNLIRIHSIWECKHFFILEKCWKLSRTLIRSQLKPSLSNQSDPWFDVVVSFCSTTKFTTIHSKAGGGAAMIELFVLPSTLHGFAAIGPILGGRHGNAAGSCDAHFFEPPPNLVHRFPAVYDLFLVTTRPALTSSVWVNNQNNASSISACFTWRASTWVMGVSSDRTRHADCSPRATLCDGWLSSLFFPPKNTSEIRGLSRWSAYMNEWPPPEEVVEQDGPELHSWG